MHGHDNRAIVTAALLTLDPATIGMLAAANMLTPDGRCKTLDAAADGCAHARLPILLHGTSLQVSPAAKCCCLMADKYAL